MKTEITITRYNLTALLGWCGIIIGLVGAGVQYFMPSAPGVYFLAGGLIGGALTVTLSGPVRSVTTQEVNLLDAGGVQRHHED